MDLALLPSWSARLAAAAALVALGACATPPEGPEAMAEFSEINDPLEPLNRAIFGFNLAVDKALVRPVSIAYRDVIPKPGRDGVRNFLDNLETPVVFANDVLQGSAERAGTTAGRFAINSTIGIVGLLDAAASFGLERHDEDFGQTLGVWGFPEGPFLMLPLLGPSPPRDSLGLVFDYFVDPLTYAFDNNDVEWLSGVRYGVRAIDSRSRTVAALDEIERTSIDFYATVRSLYRQQRADEIRNGELLTTVPGPEITLEFDEGGADTFSLIAQ